MRWLGLVVLLFAGALGLLWAADEKKADGPFKGFVVHEWGVWRVHDDVEMANADMRSQWDELPAFVYGQTRNRELPRHWSEALMEVTKPVVFFHAPKAMEAELRVDFPTGLPAVWWPATQHPALQVARPEFGQPEPVKHNSLSKYLQWKLYLQQPPVGRSQALKPLSKPHWMQTLRDVKCDDVYVSVGERLSGLEREKFVYYDGLLAPVQALTVKVERARVSLKNKEKFALFDVWIVDRREAGKPHLGRLKRLEPGAATDVDLVVQKEPKWVEAAGKALTAELREAGLHEDEAGSLTTIWTADFFDAIGVTLFYRLPQEEYDRLLPLSVKPQPEKVVRVGLIQHVLFDPDLAARIARLVKQLDHDDYAKREAAQQELATLGRAALGYLRRLKPEIIKPEAKRRLDELLDKYEAERIIKN